MRGKIGLEMVVTTVIMIILSIAVLTILIIFVNSQTGFFSKWLKNYQGESNVDVVVDSCNSLVAREAFYSYCCEEKEIILGEKGEVDEDGNVVDGGNLKQTCDKARVEDWSKGRIDELECEGIC